MDTNQINELMKDCVIFGGTWSRDTIPVLRKRPIAFVVNTDSSKEPGEHWISILLLKNGSGEFFSSFGFPPLHPQMQKYMNDQCPNGFKYTCLSIQHPSSDVCGLYCMFFIRRRIKGESYEKFMSQFTYNSIDNDNLIIQKFKDGEHRK